MEEGAWFRYLGPPASGLLVQAMLMWGAVTGTQEDDGVTYLKGE